MTIQDIYHGILIGLENMTLVEGMAVLCAIVSVFCAKANSIWVYPTGIAGILLSIYIFIGAQYKLYPDAALNFYYLTMSIYGWYFWSRAGGEEEEQTPITYCNRREYLWATLIFIVLWGSLYWWLSTYHINDVPKMDSFTSAMAATGMWLLAKRKIENWLVLAAADFVDIGLFFYKKLLLFSALNIFYVIIAIIGFIAWKKWIKKHQQYQISLS